MKQFIIIKLAMSSKKDARPWHAEPTLDNSWIMQLWRECMCLTPDYMNIIKIMRIWLSMPEKNTITLLLLLIPPEPTVASVLKLCGLDTGSPTSWFRGVLGRVEFIRLGVPTLNIEESLDRIPDPCRCNIPSSQAKFTLLDCKQREI